MALTTEKKTEVIDSMVKTGLSLLDGKLDYLGFNLEQHPYRFEFNIKRNPVQNRSFPGMLLVTLPKTGSDYIWSRLFVGLNIDKQRVSAATFPDDIVSFEQVKKLANGNAVAHGHIPARSLNLNIINLYLDRVVVHVRDPRQAVLSWLHFADEQYEQVGNEFSAVQEPMLPRDYFTWSFDEKMHWYIERHFDAWVGWIAQWIAADEDPGFSPRILFTEYKEMKNDPETFFGRILDFYDIDPQCFSIDLKQKLKAGQLHFRKGLVDEWKDTFSPELIKLTSDKIPAEWKERFDWAE